MSPESHEEFGEKELAALLEAQADGELASLRDAFVEGAIVFSGWPRLDDCTLTVVKVR